MKSNGGSTGIAPLILYLGTGWMKAVSITPRPLYPWDRALRAGVEILENRRIYAPTGIWTPDRLSRCHVAVPTGPSRIPRILTANPKPRLITLKVTVDQFSIPFRSWEFWGSKFWAPKIFYSDLSLWFFSFCPPRQYPSEHHRFRPHLSISLTINWLFNSVASAKRSNAK